jgi:hypothetical protein
MTTTFTHDASFMAHFVEPRVPVSDRPRTAGSQVTVRKAQAPSPAKPLDNLMKRRKMSVVLDQKETEIFQEIQPESCEDVALVPVDPAPLVEHVVSPGRLSWIAPITSVVSRIRSSFMQNTAQVQPIKEVFEPVENENFCENNAPVENLPVVDASHFESLQNEANRQYELMLDYKAKFKVAKEAYQRLTQEIKSLKSGGL